MSERKKSMSTRDWKDLWYVGRAIEECSIQRRKVTRAKYDLDKSVAELVTLLDDVSLRHLAARVFAEGERRGEDWAK